MKYFYWVYHCFNCGYSTAGKETYCPKCGTELTERSR